MARIDKQEAPLGVDVMPIQMDGDDFVDDKMGTAEDRAHMDRMGKKQEFRRDFRFVSMFAFTMIIMASWESTFIMADVSLVNGGRAGFVWVTFISWIGFIFINTSMAEMASMAPTTGGQYHWISEFAPREYQKFLSYFMGWLCVLGWQAGCASGAFMAGTMIQGLITLNYPDSYEPQSWHGTLLTIAISAFGVLFNIYLARKLPIIESFILVIHVFAFFGILVTLWVMSPISDARTVFTQFNDGGGWGSLGTSTLAGITAGIIPLLGADGAVHMSEELKNAGRTVPQSMVLTTVANGLTGWIMVITICFCLGSDIDAILTTSTGYPFMVVFYNSTGSIASATVMTAFIIILTVCSNLTFVATASRQLFAFARDDAVPFSPWLAKVSPKNDLPLNAILITFLTTTLLSLINIGSSTAFNSLTSLLTNALLSSYICSIGCLIWKRLNNEPLLPSKYSLGAFGLAINIISEVFLVIFFVLAFFPTTPDPTAATMNWNIAIYAAVIIYSLVYYFFKGRHRYVGPVAYVRKSQ